jgi:hypothetical protein
MSDASSTASGSGVFGVSDSGTYSSGAPPDQDRSQATESDVAGIAAAHAPMDVNGSR